jgi:hypothetical protein
MIGDVLLFLATPGGSADCAPAAMLFDIELVVVASAQAASEYRAIAQEAYTVWPAGGDIVPWL